MDALCLGELLIDFVCPEVDRSLAAAGSFVKAPGGAPANVAVGLRRLGRRSGFCGCVGADPFGDYLADVLAAEEVDLRGLTRSTARTTLAFVATRADGRKDITFYRHPGADAELRVEDLDPALIAEAKLFHFGSVSLSREPARSATLRAAEIAKEAGAIVSFDPNWRAPLWDDPAPARELFARYLALATVAKVADEELVLVTGTADENEALDRLLATGPSLAVITRGAAGSVAATRAGRATHPGYRVAVRDPLGAGDAFVAAMLSRVMDWPSWDRGEAELAELLRFANAAGALTCRRVGVIPALPTTTEIDSFLADEARS